MKNIVLLCLFFGLFGYSLIAQNVSINTDGSAAHSSAMLDVSSTTQGLLIPKMTTAQRDALKWPGDGLFIYNLTTHTLNYYMCNVGWHDLTGVTNVGSTTGATAPGQGIAINQDGSTAANSAILDVSSTAKGILIPRVANTSSVTSPGTGLLVINQNKDKLAYYNGSAWVDICAVYSSATIGTGTVTTNGVSISTSAAAPNSSAMLDVSSTTKGLLIPRMTSTERDALNPTEGLLLYNTTTNYITYWNGSNWNRIDAGTAFTAPVATAATGVGRQDYTANWNPVGGATKYALYSSCTGCDIDVGTATSYYMSDGCCASSCTYTVRAYNGSCWSDNSNTITVNFTACFTCPQKSCAYTPCWGEDDCTCFSCECP